MFVIRGRLGRHPHDKTGQEKSDEIENRRRANGTANERDVLPAYALHFPAVVRR
jgi:hypothetical protein